MECLFPGMPTLSHLISNNKGKLIYSFSTNFGQLLKLNMGIEESDTELSLITMSVHFLIAEVLGLDILDIEHGSLLESDLGMTDELRTILSSSIKEMFDGFELDYSFIKTVQDLVDQVITCKLNTEYMTLH